MSKSIAKKVAEIMAVVTHVEKAGFNKHFQYAFASAEDVAAAVRVEMSARNLMLLPGITESHTTEKGLTTIKMHYTLVCGDTGETLETTWQGMGADTQDKGLSKATTSANKYFLLTLFQIPKGDDPDAQGPIQQRPAATIATAPVPRAVGEGTRAGKDASDAQKRKVFATVKEMGLTEDEMHYVLKKKGGVESMTKLSMDAVDSVLTGITEYAAWKNAREGAGVDEDGVTASEPEDGYGL